MDELKYAIEELIASYSKFEEELEPSEIASTAQEIMEKANEVYIIANSIGDEE
jgi:hypothetical protein